MGQRHSHRVVVERKERRGSHGQDSPYFVGWEEYKRKPYHPVANPNGIIQMGLAENQLSFDLVESWLAANPSATNFQSNGTSVFREVALFQDYNGYPPFKSALAKFMEKMRGNKVHIAPNKLVLTAGATSANETLIFCLAEPGDAFLVPTPYYPGFDRDLQWRTGVEIVPVSCSSADGFRVTRPALEGAYRRARKRSKKVKGVLVTNPSNPLGTAMSRAELEALVDFVADRRIHLVSDEIYSGAVPDPADFTSVLEVTRDREGRHDVARRVHVVYSLSKDLGLPGFRAGAIYSEDGAVVSTCTKMSSFGLVSSQTQRTLAAMLSDEGFTSGYLAESRRRLRGRRETLVRRLRAAGIGCLEEGSGGLFCWVDMRAAMGRGTFEEERRVWGALLRRAGVNVTPGAACRCEEPGWFRVCFANLTDEEMEVALRRIEGFVAGGCDAAGIHADSSSEGIRADSSDA